MLTILVWILAFAITITIHEAAHAWMADRLGDPTARLEGRLTLNPVAHYDPVGTTLLLALVIMRSIGIPVLPFGWAKPVPIDPYNLKGGRRDVALVSLAGPAINLIFATILSIFLSLSHNESAFNLLFPVILLNVSLAIFNLIPVFPLDGAKVLTGIMQAKNARIFEAFMERYGILVLFLLIFPIFGGESLINIFVSPVIGVIIHLLVPGASVI